MSGHTKALFLRRQDEEDSSSSDLGSVSEGGSDDDLTCYEPEHSHRPCEMAVKLHLWSSCGILSFHLAALHKWAEALGRRGRGLQLIVLAECKPGAQPAPSAKPVPANMKKFSYNFSRQVPRARLEVFA